MNKKRNEVIKQLKSRIKKYEGKIPSNTVFDEGSAMSGVKASVKVNIKNIGGWANQPSKAGEKKAGTEGDVKHALRKICQSIGSTSWPKVKAALKDRGKIQDLYESTKDPINIHGFQFTGIQGDRREERKEDLLHYTTRDNQPKKILVASVRKTLSIIKKENNL